MADSDSAVRDEFQENIDKKVFWFTRAKVKVAHWYAASNNLVEDLNKVIPLDVYGERFKSAESSTDGKFREFYHDRDLLRALTSHVDLGGDAFKVTPDERKAYSLIANGYNGNLLLGKVRNGSVKQVAYKVNAISRRPYSVLEEEASELASGVSPLVVGAWTDGWANVSDSEQAMSINDYINISCAEFRLNGGFDQSEEKGFYKGEIPRFTSEQGFDSPKFVNSDAKLEDMAPALKDKDTFKQTMNTISNRFGIVLVEDSSLKPGSIGLKARKIFGALDAIKRRISPFNNGISITGWPKRFKLSYPKDMSNADKVYSVIKYICNSQSDELKNIARSVISANPTATNLPSIDTWTSIEDGFARASACSIASELCMMMLPEKEAQAMSNMFKVESLQELAQINEFLEPEESQQCMAIFADMHAIGINNVAARYKPNLQEYARTKGVDYETLRANLGHEPSLQSIMYSSKVVRDPELELSPEMSSNEIRERFEKIFESARVEDHEEEHVPAPEVTPDPTPMPVGDPFNTNDINIHESTQDHIDTHESTQDWLDWAREVAQNIENARDETSAEDEAESHGFRTQRQILEENRERLFKEKGDSSATPDPTPAPAPTPTPKPTHRTPRVYVFDIKLKPAKNARVLQYTGRKSEASDECRKIVLDLIDEYTGVQKGGVEGLRNVIRSGSTNPDTLKELEYQELRARTVSNVRPVFMGKMNGGSGYSRLDYTDVPEYEATEKLEQYAGWIMALAKDFMEKNGYKGTTITKGTINTMLRVAGEKALADRIAKGEKFTRTDKIEAGKELLKDAMHDQVWGILDDVHPTATSLEGEAGTTPSAETQSPVDSKTVHVEKVSAESSTKPDETSLKSIDLLWEEFTPEKRKQAKQYMTQNTDEVKYCRSILIDMVDESNARERQFIENCSKDMVNDKVSYDQKMACQRALVEGQGRLLVGANVSNMLKDKTSGYEETHKMLKQDCPYAYDVTSELDQYTGFIMVKTREFMEHNGIQNEKITKDDIDKMFETIGREECNKRSGKKRFEACKGGSDTDKYIQVGKEGLKNVFGYYVGRILYNAGDDLINGKQQGEDKKQQEANKNANTSSPDATQKKTPGEQEQKTLDDFNKGSTGQTPEQKLEQKPEQKPQEQGRW